MIISVIADECDDKPGYRCDLFFCYNRNVQLHGKFPKDDETQREREREREGGRHRERERERETERQRQRAWGGGGEGHEHEALIDPHCFINEVATVTTRMIPALR